jgi:hypothetical protein
VARIDQRHFRSTKAVDDLKQLSAERSRVLEMSQIPEKNEEEYEVALERYRSDDLAAHAIL